MPLDIPRRALLPVKCSIDGNHWDRQASGLPPCSHTDAEWQAHYDAMIAAGKTDMEARQRWLPDDPPGAKAVKLAPLDATGKLVVE